MDRILESCGKESYIKNEIAGAELAELLKQREAGVMDFLLIDVREKVEFDALSIKGADFLLPMSEFYKEARELQIEKDKNIILYCRSGHRSLYAKEILSYFGFKHITNLTFGIEEYKGEVVSTK